MAVLTLKILKEIKKELDETREKASELYKQLLEGCFHPKAYMRTYRYYETDTLGRNGKNVYQDNCQLCGQHVSVEYEGRANHEEIKR